MNTEKYCRACNEKDGHAEGCEIDALEQQLAQAREANGLLAIKNGKLGRERDQARANLEVTADYAQGLESWQIEARALLERATFEMENWNEELDREIRAFLARKEQTNG